MDWVVQSNILSIAAFRWPSQIFLPNSLNRPLNSFELFELDRHSFCIAMLAIERTSGTAVDGLYRLQRGEATDFKLESE
jgi:hypothetical protein